jgi:hypothetical protein
LCSRELRAPHAAASQSCGGAAAGAARAAAPPLPPHMQSPAAAKQPSRRYQLPHTACCFAGEGDGRISRTQEPTASNSSRSSDVALLPRSALLGMLPTQPPPKHLIQEPVAFWGGVCAGAIGLSEQDDGPLRDWVERTAAQAGVSLRGSGGWVHVSGFQHPGRVVSHGCAFDTCPIVSSTGPSAGGRGQGAARGGGGWDRRAGRQ